MFSLEVGTTHGAFPEMKKLLIPETAGFFERNQLWLKSPRGILRIGSRVGKHKERYPKLNDSVYGPVDLRFFLNRPGVESSGEFIRKIDQLFQCPCLIMSGLPGVGKSRIADHLAKMTGRVVFSTDRIRRELFPEITQTEPGAPSYSPEKMRLVYEEVVSRAAGWILKNKQMVILDGTFLNRAFRTMTVERLSQLGIESFFATVICEESLVKKRLKRGSKRSASFADFDVYLWMKKRLKKGELSWPFNDGLPTMVIENR